MNPIWSFKFISKFLRPNRNSPNIKVKLSNESKTSASKVSKGPYFIAVHASSEFSRAAIVTKDGKIVKIALQPIKLTQNGIFYEMSSTEIWEATVRCIKKVSENIKQEDIKGIGFTATSALVCLDEKGNSVTASVSRDPKLNTIAYFDQRSLLETALINKTHHALLNYFGNAALPELQESKLLWLKNNLKADCWDKVGHFFELSDFLTWKATNSLTRSSSVINSKWSYEMTVSGHEGWNDGFFTEIGMPELQTGDWAKIGSKILRPGTSIPDGLSEKAAAEMALRPGLPVATSMTDGFAGGLGLMGCQVDDVDTDVTSKLCIVFGTRASAHLLQSRDPVFVRGVWGPFKDCVLPGMWLNQAGQTTAESVMEYIMDMHPSVGEIRKQMGKMHIHKYLNKILKIKAQKHKLKARSYLTSNFHILPDFEGNRSPLSDPSIRGMISGLTLSSGQESLAIGYLAAMQALAYSTRHIMSQMSQHGHKIKSIIIGGSLGKNSLFTYLHKDICHVPTISPDEASCKLIGGAILGAVASGYYRDFNEAIEAMCGKGQAVFPDDDKEIIEYHNKKYEVFLKMYSHQKEYERIMSGVNGKIDGAKH